MEKYEYYSVGLPAVWLHQENQQGGLLFFNEQGKPQKTITVGFFYRYIQRFDCWWKTWNMYYDGFFPSYTFKILAWSHWQKML